MKRKLKKEKKQYFHKQKFSLFVPTFDSQVHFFVNYKDKDTIKHLCKHKVGEHDKLAQAVNGFESDPGTNGRAIATEGGYVVLLKFKHKTFRYSVATLVHEITHVVAIMLGERGIKLTPDTDEVYAYSIGDLTGRALFKLYD